MASGKSWATAAVQASRKIAGREQAEPEDKPRNSSGGTITPAVSRKRLPLRPRGGARPSVHDGKHQRVSPKNANSRQPRKIAAARPWSGREARRAARFSSLKNGAERRTRRDREHARHKKSRRKRRAATPCPRTSSIDARARRAADVARAQKQRAFGQAVGPDVKQRRRNARAAERRADAQNAHVLHAGIGEHPFEIARAQQEQRRHQHGKQVRSPAACGPAWRPRRRRPRLLARAKSP